MEVCPACDGDQDAAAVRQLEYDERADSRTLRYKAYCITGQAPNCNACLDGTLRARAPLTSVQSRRTVVERTSLQRVAATYTMPRTRMQPPLHLLAHLVLLLCACSAAASAAAALAHEHGPLSHQEGMALLSEQLRMAQTEHAQLRSWLARVDARSHPAAGASTGSGCGSGAAERVQHTRHRADVWGSVPQAGDGNSSTRAAARAVHDGGVPLSGGSPGTVQHAAHRAVQLARLRVSRRQEEVAWLEQAIGECAGHAAQRGGRFSEDATGSRATVTVPRPGGVLGVIPGAPRPVSGRVPTCERQALMSLFDATNGDNWGTSELWGSPVPVCVWYGVGCNPSHTHVVTL